VSDQIAERLNQILPKLISEDFLSTRGIGNEIAFYIFDYAPEDEIQVREHVELLVQHLPKHKPGLRVGHINLFSFLIGHLNGRGLLAKAYTLQREKGDEALHKALKGVLHEEKVASLIADTVTPDEQNLVLISGVGSSYPLLRSHTLLNNLHAIMGQTPLVMFYPGKYDTQTLRLFGKTALAGGPTEERKKKTNYYRAFRLID
jgi:hypothetical protein